MGMAVSFLVRCAEWIGEGDHMYLLRRILDFGFDPSIIDCPLVKNWPRMSNPNWWSEEHTPDPFFIEYMACLVKDNPGEMKWPPLGSALSA